MPANAIHIVDEHGHPRSLGNVPPPRKRLKYVWPKFGDSPQETLIPQSEWPDRIKAIDYQSPDWDFLPPVHDQDGIGQCNCDDTTALLEYLRNKQGLKYVPLSAADLYNRINGGADNGSMLEDAMAEVTHNGVDTVEHCGTLWKRGMQKGDPETRKLYRAIEVSLCPSFDHCMSTVIQAHGLSSGVMWYNNYTPGQDGWLPLNGRGGGGGHAVFGYKPTMREVSNHVAEHLHNRLRGRLKFFRINTKASIVFGIWHQNSWTPQWGKGGRCVFPQTMYSQGGIGGWWAGRAVVDEGGDVPAPKFLALNKETKRSKK